MYRMLPYRRSMALRPINRIKHVVDANGSVDDTPTVVVPLADAVDNPVLTAPTEVLTGAKINGIYLHVEVSHTSGTGRPMIFMMVSKNPGNNLTMPAPNAVGINDNKKHVIHQEMIMMSGDAGNGLPRPIFNGVIAIPKHMRRFGPDDNLSLALITGTASLTADWCMQCHYKEFR